MRNQQKNHAGHIPGGRQYPLDLLLDNIKTPQNVGSLFRLADALGIRRLYLCGNTPCPPNPKIKKTSRSTENSVAWSQQDDAVALAGKLKNRNMLLVALEISTQSIALDAPEFQQQLQDRQVCLVLGSENTGIQDGLLQLADVSVHIPMQGQNSSMNVAVAASIACYEILKSIYNKE